MSIQCVAKQFIPKGSIAEIDLYGNGLINDTYRVKSGSTHFILQKLNSTVFPEPLKLMKNLEVLFEHIRMQPVSTVNLTFPEIIRTQNGELCYLDDNSEFWRALSFIENTTSFEIIECVENAEQVGFALGHFHRLTSSLNPELLQDSLPGFHITPGYLSHYHQIKNKTGCCKQPAEAVFCENFIKTRQHQAHTLEKAKNQGLLLLRVIHGDPKLNNLLFDRHSMKAVSLIDLDTVKPGLVHYDIGDCLRSCCNTGLEDSSTAHFELDICETLLKSYLSEAESFFKEPDYDYLFESIQLIPFELGLRFYTDFLEGNRYFKVSEPNQNLARAKGQFHLVESIERQGFQIQQLINHLRR